MVGTPIRQGFLDACRFHIRAKPGDRQHVLMFGGSQGAKAVNSAAMEGLPELLKRRSAITVTHQTGESDHARVKEAYDRAGVS